MRVLLATLEHLETLALQEPLEETELEPQQEMLEEPTLDTQEQQEALVVVVLL